MAESRFLGYVLVGALAEDFSSAFFINLALFVCSLHTPPSKFTFFEFQIIRSLNDK